VIRGGAIGDFILTLPVLAALRERLPRNHLEVLGYPHMASLALSAGLVDAVRPIESRPMAGFFARGGDLDPQLASYFSTFNLIVSFLFDPDLIFRGNIARVSRAQFIQGLHRPDERGPLHATEQLLGALQSLAIFDADPVPRFCAGPPLNSQELLLAVHPGSGSSRKNWPEARWRELLAELVRQEPLRFLLLGGEAEEGRLERLAAELPGGRVEVLRSRPLPEVAGRLACCCGFLGHDSGITHLAAAVGLPGVVLWGPTNEAVWRPRGSKMHLVMAGESLSELPVSIVLGAVRESLPALALT
jgi:ADP-heptose:LPS heptosyltransferase